MARARGTRSLREAALALALAGRTSFDEVERVTDG
jgi:type II secretory ATPase GspE/PulE/Tfp pilus assembly ATPase PilB-like protein